MEHDPFPFVWIPYAFILYFLHLLFCFFSFLLIIHMKHFCVTLFPYLKLIHRVLSTLESHQRLFPESGRGSWPALILGIVQTSCWAGWWLGRWCSLCLSSYLLGMCPQIVHSPGRWSAEAYPPSFIMGEALLQFPAFRWSVWFPHLSLPGRPVFLLPFRNWIFGCFCLF